MEAAHAHHGHDDHAHHPSGIMRWITTTNHKDIGTLYLVFSLTMFFVGGLLALMLRLELFEPGMQLIPFDLVAHPHTQSSVETARVLGVPPDRIAKGVLLDGLDCQMVAMIPADQEIHFGRLGLENGVEFRLADEASVSRLFTECEPGVVPGLPNAWGVEMVWDDDLMAQPDIYLEVGDHERLLHIETRYLREVFGDAPHCHFSQPRMQHVAR